MNSPKSHRNRNSFYLTDEAKDRISRKIKEQANKKEKNSLSFKEIETEIQLHANEGLNRTTVAKVLQQKTLVDKKSIQLLFSTFDLELKDEDLTRTFPKRKSDSNFQVNFSGQKINGNNNFKETQVSLIPVQTFSQSSTFIHNLSPGGVGIFGKTENFKGNNNQNPKIKPDAPGRPLKPGSPFYISFPDEEQWIEEILEPGVLIRIRAARRMGKTSLIYRILNYAHTEGYQTVYLNLKQQTDERILSDLNLFLQWFCTFISESLGLTPQPNLFSDGGKHGCTKYIQEFILKPLDIPLVLALDEVDCLFGCPNIVQDFFSLLRGWYEMAKNPGMEIWEQLRVVISHSTDNYLKLDSAQSPFGNVGFPIKLPLWHRQQIEELVKHYQLKCLDREAISHLITIVDGHPYLIQMALYHLWKDKAMSLEQLLDLAPTSEGIYRNHLRQLWKGVQEPCILNSLQQLLESQGSIKVNQEQGFKLEGMGLVQFQGNRVRLSCELYRRYFQEWLTVKD